MKNQSSTKRGGGAIVEEESVCREETDFTVLKTSLFFSGDGFTAYDSKGGVRFRVDNYDGGENYELVLLDRTGRCILTVRRKREKEALKKAGELATKMNEMNALITVNNKELQKVREELMKEIALNNTLDGGDNSSIGVKKIGELDVNVFKRACAKRFPVGEAEIIGVELCSIWQAKLYSLWSWQVKFQRFRDDEGNLKVVVKEDNGELCGLKKEWGIEAYNAVATALVDLLDTTSVKVLKNMRYGTSKRIGRRNLRKSSAG